MLKDTITIFAVLMVGLCFSIDFYWKVKGFFKKRCKNNNSRSFK